mmetsp:Transcript_5400/g.11905  ORF Transcript_5400/g.11905 Transcript_5400/m.11905 type:complete len:219 (-) Transcript_5400:900-1556(-)
MCCHVLNICCSLCMGCHSRRRWRHRKSITIIHRQAWLSMVLHILHVHVMALGLTVIGQQVSIKSCIVSKSLSVVAPLRIVVVEDASDVVQGEELWCEDGLPQAVHLWAMQSAAVASSDPACRWVVLAGAQHAQEDAVRADDSLGHVPRDEVDHLCDNVCWSQHSPLLQGASSLRDVLLPTFLQLLIRHVVPDHLEVWVSTILGAVPNHSNEGVNASAR